MEFEARALTGTIIADRYFVGEVDSETDVATTFYGTDTRTGAMLTITVPRAGLDMTTACEIHHPSIVTPRDVGMLPSGKPFVITALYPGATLAARVSTGGGLVTGDVVRIGLDLLSALAAAHDLNVLHGDLRPESVFLVERDGLILQTLLSGFGRRPGADESFVAPELVAGCTPSISSDLYAAGALLYFAATGCAPPPRSTLSSMRVSLRWLPARVARVIARALDEEPATRFSSAREMLNVLDVGRGGGGRTVDAQAESTSMRCMPMYAELIETRVDPLRMRSHSKA